MTRIAIDAMGGDHAPAEIVAGAVWAAQEYGVGLDLVGKVGIRHNGFIGRYRQHCHGSVVKGIADGTVTGIAFERGVKVLKDIGRNASGLVLGRCRYGKQHQR